MINKRGDSALLHRSLITNIALLVCTTLLLYLCAEGFLRFLIWKRTPDSMVFEPDIVYSFKPYSVAWGTRLNNIGCIGDDVVDSDSRPSNEFRILLLGGSTSFSSVYVDAVRREVTAKLPKDMHVKVISCGRPRYTSYMNMANYRDHLEHVDEDVLIIYLGINDNIYNTFPMIGEPPLVGFFDWKSTRPISLDYIFYHLIHKKLMAIPDFKLPYRSPAMLENNLKEIINIAQSRKSSVILSTFAVALPSSDPKLLTRIEADSALMEHFWGTKDAAIGGVMAHNVVISKIASAYKIPLVNIADLIPHDSEHFIDLCHMKEPSYNSIALEFAKEVYNLHTHGSHFALLPDYFDYFDQNCSKNEEHLIKQREKSKKGR